MNDNDGGNIETPHQPEQDFNAHAQGKDQKNEQTIYEDHAPQTPEHILRPPEPIAEYVYRGNWQHRQDQMNGQTWEQYQENYKAEPPPDPLFNINKEQDSLAPTEQRNLLSERFNGIMQEAKDNPPSFFKKNGEIECEKGGRDAQER